MTTHARQKLDQLISSAKQPVAIFDLDGTVFDVTYRTLEIVKRFIAQPEINSRFPEHVSIARKLKHSSYLYSLEATLNSAGIDRYSEHSAHFLHLAETYWYKHFFTDDLLSADLPYAGALECVRYFHSQGAHVVYLSGRDIPNMSRGTIESLEKHGFPHTGHGVTICLKPAYGQDDLLFKKQSLETISTLGHVVATFDNEPANVKLFIESFPNAINVHFNTLYAKKIDLQGSNLLIIKAFKDLGFG